MREHLGIKRWFVTGVSWGSTLALAYAEAHPDRVDGLALLAVTSTSREEVDWITDGVARLFPEAWARLLVVAEPQPGERVVEEVTHRVRNADPKVRELVATAWAEWAWPAFDRRTVEDEGHGGSRMWELLVEAIAELERR